MGPRKASGQSDEPFSVGKTTAVEHFASSDDRSDGCAPPERQKRKGNWVNPMALRKASSTAADYVQPASGKRRTQAARLVPALALAAVASFMSVLVITDPAVAQQQRGGGSVLSFRNANFASTQRPALLARPSLLRKPGDAKRLRRSPQRPLRQGGAARRASQPIPQRKRALDRTGLNAVLSASERAGTKRASRSPPVLTAPPAPVRLLRPGIASTGGLLLAASHGQLKAVKAHLKRMRQDNQLAELEERDNDGNTAIMLASAAGKPAIVRVLIDAGARAHVRNQVGNSALAGALRRGRVDIAKLLLGAGALRDISPDDRAQVERLAISICRHDLVPMIAQRTPISPVVADQLLSIAVTRCDPIVLLQLSAVLNVGQGNDKTGQRAIFKAIRYGNEEAAQFLLGRGVDPNVVNADGMTALTEAAVRGRHATALLLLDKGADINKATGSGNTALMLAAHAGFKSLLQALIARRADLDRRNNTGMTALMFAARSGKGQIAQVLLAAGANRYLRNSKRERAVDLARSAGYGDVVAIVKPDGGS